MIWIILGAVCGSIVFYYAMGILTALSLAAAVRRQSNTHYGPLEIAATVVFWPIAALLLVGYYVMAHDHKVAKREVERFDQDQLTRRALEMAHDDLAELQYPLGTDPR